MASPLEIFCCYARKDQQFLNDLKDHLMSLERQGLITVWADTDINAGSEWEKEIEKHLNTAQIILLLVSPAFMNSDYCYSKEMKQALERHKQGEARVIPIILRPVYWQSAPFGKLQALPKGDKAITSWINRDDAFLDIVKGSRLTKERATKLIIRRELTLQEKVVFLEMLYNKEKALVFNFSHCKRVYPKVAPPQVIKTVEHKA